MRTKGRYNFRYFLPYAPEWGTAEHCDQRLRELLDFCREAKLDAVQFFVNTLPGTYYMPAHNVAEQAHWAAWMKETVAPTLRKIGVSYQLNLQMLLGAHSGGLDMRDEYGWGCLVNQYGVETQGCACPLDAEFRRLMGEMLRLWAGTGPDIIWVDDDFRMHNHGQAPGELDFYCYCDRHLAAFAKFAGRTYSREELVAEVLRPGAPSPLRGQWLDFLNGTMVESAAWLRREVQGVSPHTRLALMTSAPDVHSAEGRDWKGFLSALCGDFPPITRPCSGAYTGTAVPIRTQTSTYRFMGQSIHLVDEAFGPGVAEYGPELENTRFTTWCKSVRNTEYVLALGQLLGCPEITLSMADLDGSSLSEEPTNLPLLRDNKPRLDALAALDLREWRKEGVVFLSDPDAARKVRLPSGSKAKMQDLGLLRQWEDPLLQMGIPAYYATPAEAAAGGDVVVLEGYTAWCPTDEELERILGGRVLLDADAAQVIQERGFSHLLGVRVGDRASYKVHAESYCGGVLPGIEPIRVPNRNGAWREIELAGATLVSELIDPKNRRHVGNTIFENACGGRVAVCACVGDTEGSIANHARLRWLHGGLHWLSRETFRALPVIPHHGLTVLRSRGCETLLAFANLGTDAMRELKVRLAQPFAGLKVLDRSGRWRTLPPRCSPDTGLVSITCQLEAFEWLVVMITACETGEAATREKARLDTGATSSTGGPC